MKRTSTTLSLMVLFTFLTSWGLAAWLASMGISLPLQVGVGALYGYVMGVLYLANTDD